MVWIYNNYAFSYLLAHLSYFGHIESFRCQIDMIFIVLESLKDNLQFIWRGRDEIMLFYDSKIFINKNERMKERQWMSTFSTTFKCVTFFPQNITIRLVGWSFRISLAIIVRYHLPIYIYGANHEWQWSWILLNKHIIWIWALFSFGSRLDHILIWSRNQFFCGDLHLDLLSFLNHRKSVTPHFYHFHQLLSIFSFTSILSQLKLLL